MTNMSSTQHTVPKKNHALFVLAFLAFASVMLDVILRRNEGITVESITGTANSVRARNTTTNTRSLHVQSQVNATNKEVPSKSKVPFSSPLLVTKKADVQVGSEPVPEPHTELQVPILPIPQRVSLKDDQMDNAESDGNGTEEDIHPESIQKDMNPRSVSLVTSFSISEMVK